MRLTFLGTRGNIRIASAVHRYHAALLVQADGLRVMVDAGEDWRGRLQEVRPDAILVTHAHPDHAGALRDGAPCPVYATPATRTPLARFPLDLRTLRPGDHAQLESLTFSAHVAAHSLLAPAVGYRIEHAGVRLFYVPDVLELADARAALRGVSLYVGDGATYGRPIVRERDGDAFGHATIETQLDWCSSQRVRRATFTHCGSRIVRVEPGDIAERVARFGKERNVSASIAVDGDVIELRARA